MEICINTHSHNLVVDEHGRPIFSEDQKSLLVSQIADNALLYVPKHIVEEVFGTVQFPLERDAISTSDINENWEETSTLGTLSDTEKKLWTRSDTLRLISLYKEHKSLFKSTTIRNDKIWKLISDKIKNYSAEQCKNKFKYLKSKYTKKKDNMSIRASGQDSVLFEFFEEFDSIFASEPNISPIAIASTSREIINDGKVTNDDLLMEQDTTSPENEEIQLGDKVFEVTEPISSQASSPAAERDGVTGTSKVGLKKEKKTKKTQLAKEVEKMTDEIRKLREDLKEREENKQIRHKEALQQKAEATDAFKEYIKFLKNSKS